MQLSSAIGNEECHLSGNKNFNVQLNGHLVRTNLSLELMAILIGKNPLLLFLFPFWIVKGNDYFIKKVLSKISINVASLPYNQEYLQLINKHRERGDSICLVAGSFTKIGEEVSKYLGVFDNVMMGPNPHSEWINLSNSNVTFSRKIKIWIKQLRIHQWVKNVLIFVPLFLSQQITHVNVIAVGIFAFLSFSLCASSVYILNDLLDLENDRLHHQKKNRPLAKGDIPISHAIIALFMLLIVSFSLAIYLLPLLFTLILCCYFTLTLLYSFRFKKMLLVDVFTLASLYTIRIIAGHEASGIAYSPWLLGFSMFIFLSLAFLKRYSELHNLKQSNQNLKIKGRGYLVQDLEQIRAFGVACGVTSILVLSLYITSDKVLLLYQFPERLLPACVPILFWICRLWFFANRGLMHEDPIVFAVKDRVSYYCAFFVFLVMMSAIGLKGH